MQERAEFWLSRYSGELDDTALELSSEHENMNHSMDSSASSPDPNTLNTSTQGSEQGAESQAGINPEEPGTSLGTMHVPEEELDISEMDIHEEEQGKNYFWISNFCDRWIEEDGTVEEFMPKAKSKKERANKIFRILEANGYIRKLEEKAYKGKECKRIPTREGLENGIALIEPPNKNFIGLGFSLAKTETIRRILEDLLRSGY